MTSCLTATAGMHGQIVLCGRPAHTGDAGCHAKGIPAPPHTGEDDVPYIISPLLMRRLFGIATKGPLRMALFLRQDESRQVRLNSINVRWRLGAPLFNDPYTECRVLISEVRAGSRTSRPPPGLNKRVSVLF
jgi:hypothetical protein